MKEIALVTGANGFVGSHLVDVLLEKGFAVKCLVRGSSNLRWLENKPVEIIKAGLYDIDKLIELFQDVAYIYHVAGVVKAKKPEGYSYGNVEATRCILEAATHHRQTVKKVVIVSSQTACGPSENEQLTREADELHPITNYGRSKKAQEELARSYMDRLPITICRPPAVFGERDTEIFIFFNTFVKGLTTTIGFDKKVISMIHVRDLVEGLVLAGIRENAAGQTYFITSKEIYTWQQIIAVTSEIWGKKPITVAVPHPIVYCIAAVAQFISYFQKQPATLNIEKARDITRHAWICSPDKAKAELGFEQKINLKEGIKRTLDWYKEQKWI